MVERTRGGEPDKILTSPSVENPDFSVRDCHASAVRRHHDPLMTGALRNLPIDGWILIATRLIRLFAYGSLSVVLVFYLVGVGLSEREIGTLFTMTLIGDT